MIRHACQHFLPPAALLLAMGSTASAAPRSVPAEDARALRALERRVLDAARGAPDWALERALERIEVKAGVTVFENLPSNGEDEEMHFPRRRPRGVRADEWQALQAFGKADGGRDGERGRARYRLFDIDGDGLRDLVAEVYNGGTSLVTESIAWRRTGPRFVSSGFSFFESGRGGNDGGTWIRLNGRVYAAVREGRHGQDTVTLVRPFAANAVPRPVLTLRYRYQLGDPVPAEHQRDKAAPLAPTLRRGIEEAVARAGSGVAPQRPLCPVPEGIDPDSEPDFEPPHYFMEHIGDAPVWVEGHCHPGQLKGWYGRYGRKEGLEARFCMVSADDAETAATCYRVNGKRALVDTQAGVEQH